MILNVILIVNIATVYGRLHWSVPNSSFCVAGEEGVYTDGVNSVNFNKRQLKSFFPKRVKCH